jgi:hypothetical protein
VYFKLRDIFVPPARDVLEQLHGDDLLRGRVIGVTEKGAAQEIHLVIEVEGVKTAVVVPLAHIVRVV